ncbi:MAG: hypothetical protein JWO67_3123 [Streptosporangiaceae bacterium]|nr:hypothetical protein [Streptosporangiaceae bacterium]
MLGASWTEGATDVMAGLLDPLDDAQRLLVDIVWTRFVDAGKFPKYFYIEYYMRGAGYQAEAVLKSFPSVGKHLRAGGYRAVDWWANGLSPNLEGPVRLTLAGLHHLQDDPQAGAIRRGLLAFMRELTKAQRRILDSPFERPNLEVDLWEALKSAGEGQGVEDHIVLIADQEWPGIRFQQQPARGELGVLTEANFFTTDAYLNAVTAALTPPAAPAELPYIEPRGLLRALNFLDVTCELVLGASLVPRPPMDRSSLLAMDAATEAEFQAGVVVLAEILRDLLVPGNNPSHALGRLQGHLVSQLPVIDETAVQQAIERLDQMRVVRNSFVHPKPSPSLLQAHHALGLTFPIRDFGAAWDSVRAHAESSLRRLQEEIQAARP